MPKIDLRKTLKHLYQPSARDVVRVNVPAFRFLMIDAGSPWWSDDLSSFAANDRSKWRWTMMIHQPPYADDAVLGDAIAAVKRKKGLAAVDALRLESFAEGAFARTLHVGPFTDEGPTIRRVHDFIETRGALAGKHHEIYLSDIRRADASRWKTIIRQPMT